MTDIKSKTSIIQMYSRLFITITNLIFQPKKMWRDVVHTKNTIDQTLTNYNLPTIGFLTVVAFTWHCISNETLSFPDAIKKAIFIFSACFFGLFISFFLLLKFFDLTKRVLRKETVFKIVALPANVIYILSIIQVIHPHSWLWWFALYILFIVWNGISIFMLDTKYRLWHTLIISISIVLPPILLINLFNLLIII